MATPLAVFMIGMLREKSNEAGMTLQAVLVVDNAVPDAKSFSSSSADDSSDHSVASDISEDLDASSNMEMLRWSASMGDKRSIAKLKAAEESRREMVPPNELYMNKLRWSASMGDAASMAILKQENRWCASIDQSTVSSQDSAKPLKKPRRRLSLTMAKLKIKCYPGS
eukprot:scaffold22540_cov137-Cylindrotheca_fusiformis.AAC.1